MLDFDPAVACLPGSVTVEGEISPTPMNAFNLQQIDKLLAKLGNSSPQYQRSRPPYAVFDWDNTSVFLDVEEATLVYQLRNLAFAATPPEMEQALPSGLPLDPRTEALLEDLSESYRWLYQKYGSLGDRLPTDAIELDSRLLAFRAKFLYLYRYLESSYGPEVAYPWMPFRFSGMTATQVRTVTANAVRWQLGEAIADMTWTSPSEWPGRAGVVSVHWRSGLRLLTEMQSLHRRLREAGFDVWICTASFVEGIREISSGLDFGYANDPLRVIGLELDQDAKGRYRPNALAGSEFTYGDGKSRAIRRRLLSEYGYGPALVAGDSQGDYAMLTDFSDTVLSLIVDRRPSPRTPIGQLLARARSQRGQSDARYLIQERDEKRGRFLD